MRLIYGFICLCALLLPINSWAKTLVVLGDSLSAAYGISAEQGWVKLLDQRLQQQYPKQYKVVNASVSGETTSGALARLPKVLQQYKPDILIIELGGNDALRGQPPQQIQRNLDQMVRQAKTAKAKVVLFGMKIPPNYGATYSKAFENTYAQVAKTHNIQLLPFFLDGVGGVSSLMQADRIHPNAKAQPRLLNNAWPVIRKVL